MRQIRIDICLNTRNGTDLKMLIVMHSTETDSEHSATWCWACSWARVPVFAMLRQSELWHTGEGSGRGVKRLPAEIKLWFVLQVQRSPHSPWYYH